MLAEYNSGRRMKTREGVRVRVDILRAGQLGLLIKGICDILLLCGF